MAGKQMVNILCRDDNMTDVISQICLMPKDFKINGTKSMIQLLKESGYFGLESSITKDRIIKFLLSHPNLVKDWEIYSSDRRSEGWYLLHEESIWFVGYSGAQLSSYGRDKKYQFISAIEACAFFIIKEVEHLAEHLT